MFCLHRIAYSVRRQVFRLYNSALWSLTFCEKTISRGFSPGSHSLITESCSHPYDPNRNETKKTRLKCTRQNIDILGSRILPYAVIDKRLALPNQQKINVVIVLFRWILKFVVYTQTWLQHNAPWQKTEIVDFFFQLIIIMHWQTEGALRHVPMQWVFFFC